jgi:hypothetical protein
MVVDEASAWLSPNDPNSLTYRAVTARLSFRAEFKAGDGGKTAVSMTRWVNTRGEEGPWSEIAAATTVV